MWQIIEYIYTIRFEFRIDILYSYIVFFDHEF